MSTVTQEAEKGPRSATVAAAVPLALLETVRTHDRPTEVLEAENLTVSLPRRLGLSDVVFTQIRRYETAKEAGRRIPISELLDLLRLVLRRPDAAMILLETGRRVARERFEKVPDGFGRVYRVLPDALLFIPVRRAVRRMLRGLSGGSRVSVKGNPLSVILHASPTGRLDTTACLLYTGALEEVLRLYGGRARRVVHERCTARGDVHCEWTLPVDGAAGAPSTNGG